MERSIRYLCPLLLGLASFWPVLFQDRQFGYRDAGDYYYPLYLRVQQEWRAGRLPLWEPEENGGVPLLGNPTACVLYPAKLIYAALPYPWAARFYIITHVGIAYLAMWILMRGWGVGHSAAALAATGYAFGGPVLLQYCNVIFLVGAAWLPLAFHFADRWLRLAERRSLAWLAMVLAVQTLGGDPEAAYISLLAAAAYAVGLSLTLAEANGRLRRRSVALAIVLAYVVLLVWQLWYERSGGLSGAAGRLTAERLAAGGWLAVAATILVHWLRTGRRWGLCTRLLGLAGAGALAMLIGGIQLVPTLEFIALTTRAASGPTPVSVYDFSIHPARVVETIWPSVFGTVGQGNHRWLEALPPTYEFQVWLDSLYQGGLIVILGLAAAGFRRGPAWRTWLTCVMLVGLLAGLGTHGSPFFWAKHLQSLWAGPGTQELAAEGSTSLPGAFGGVYWFLATALPGFASFRYPGKLLVVASLGLCGLAGLGWDDVLGSSTRRAKRLSAGFLAMSFSLMIVLLVPAGRERFLRFVDAHPDLTTTVFGPLMPAGALADLWRALIHGAVTTIAGVLILRKSARFTSGMSSCALGVLTLDLALAISPLIHTAPQQAFEARPRVLADIDRAEAAAPTDRPFRIHRMPNWAPLEWLASGSPDRIESILRWDRDSVRPKYAITEGGSYTITKGAAELADVVPFFETKQIQLDPETSKANELAAGSRIIYYTRRGFDLWNTRYFILPARLAFGSRFRGALSFLPRTTEIDPPPGAFGGPDGQERRRRWLREEDVQVLRNDAAFPRAWIVHRARMPRLADIRTSSGRDRLMDEILYQDDELWHVEGRRVHDPRAVAWLEVDDRDRQQVARFLSGSDPEPAESVAVDGYEPQRVALTANLRSPGLVVLSDSFYPDWVLTIDGKPAPILRANRAMRGALVPEGKHQLVYTYRPFSFRLGVALSLVGIIAFIALSGLVNPPRLRQ
jgi:hypothetical protein